MVKFEIKISDSFGNKGKTEFGLTNCNALRLRGSIRDVMVANSQHENSLHMKYKHDAAFKLEDCDMVLGAFYELLAEMIMPDDDSDLHKCPYAKE